jgi:RsiW-degrading membrane proteinase PrsW (M82 family)
MSVRLPAPPQDPDERRAGCRRSLTCGCIGCGGLFFLAGIALVLVSAVPNPVALTIAATAAILPVPTYTFLILQLDRYEHEPWLVLVAAFLWGAVVATFIAAMMNDLLGMAAASVVGQNLADALESSAIAPIVEEAAKGSALLILFFMVRREFDNTLDGIVYGSLVGIGFAMTENVLYFGREYQSDGLIGVGMLFYFRVVLGGLGHALYTGTTGAALGYAREVSKRWMAVVIVPIGYFCAVLQHASWNFLGAGVIPSLLPDDLNPLILLFVVMPITSVVFTAPGLVTLVIVAILAWHRESNVIREFLKDEVTRGTLTAEEYAVLPLWRQRMRTEWGMLRRKGLRAFFALRDFHQAATELAFKKWHVSRGETPKRAQRRTLEDQYRDQLAILRMRFD